MSYARFETAISRIFGPRFDRARATRARPGIEWVPTSMGDVRIRRFGGEGRRRVVLCTDMPNVIEDYDEVGVRLAQTFEPIVVEPPGTGGSWPGADFRFSREHLVQAVAQVLEVLGPSHLVMPCYLGHVGLVLGAERPPLVKSLVLPQVPTATGLRRWADRVDPNGLLRTPFVGQLVVRLRQRDIASRWYAASGGERSLGSGARDAFDFGGCWCLASLLQRFSPVEDSRSPVTSGSRGGTLGRRGPNPSWLRA